jgi:hypothetical protein
MATSFDPSRFVREFLETAAPNLGLLPAPFDYPDYSAGDGNAKLPVGLRGKLSQIRETEGEITARFLWKRGALTQACITNRTYNSSVHDSKQQELDLNEEKERSAARERWFCDLSPAERAAFDQYCLAIAGLSVESILPSDLPTCLRGSVARLALEAAEVAKRYKARRLEIEKSFHNRALSNPTVMPCFLNRLDEDEKAAISRIAGRWCRELTPDQQAEFDDVARPQIDSLSPGILVSKLHDRHAKGDAEEKLIEGLLAHHKYNYGGCGNFEPVKNNALADFLDVGRATTSEFFKRVFGGHSAYVGACRNKTRLCAKLKVLARDYSDGPTFGRTPPGEGPDEDE